MSSCGATAQEGSGQTPHHGDREDFKKNKKGGVSSDAGGRYRRRDRCWHAGGQVMGCRPVPISAIYRALVRRAAGALHQDGGARSGAQGAGARAGRRGRAHRGVLQRHRAGGADRHGRQPQASLRGVRLWRRLGAPGAAARRARHPPGAGALAVAATWWLRSGVQPGGSVPTLRPWCPACRGCACSDSVPVLDAWRLACAAACPACRAQWTVRSLACRTS